MNPMQMVQMMISRNPNMQNNSMLNNAMQMAQKNDVKGMQQMAERICKEKGLNLTDVQKQVMQRFNMMQ